eukprot:1393607-Alexandrium_andersonii.AAC.1
MFEVSCVRAWWQRAGARAALTCRPPSEAPLARLRERLSPECLDTLLSRCPRGQATPSAALV